MPVDPLRPGDPPYLGPYRLAARLGAGGMGVVYLGDSPGGPVAVKTLRRELADQPELRARFAREIAVLQQVGGVCTVRVLDARMDVATPYLVTEYVPGLTLEAYIGAHGPLPGDQLRPLAIGLAEALVAIHAAGVVHRDLKPANVILGPRGQGPKVIDFGIAQLSDAVPLTRTGLIVGSVAYMAPEQVKGRPGPGADIFSWAITVAYAAQGRPPFGEGPSEAVIYRTLNDEPDLADVPDDLAEVLRKALVKDPTTRPSAAELLAELTGRPAGAAELPDSDETRQILSRTWIMPTPVLPPPPPRPPGPPGVRPGAPVPPFRPPVPVAAPRALVPAGPPPPRWPGFPPPLRRHPGPAPRPAADRGWTPAFVVSTGLVLVVAVVIAVVVLIHHANGTASSGASTLPAAPAVSQSDTPSRSGNPALADPTTGASAASSGLAPRPTHRPAKPSHKAAADPGSGGDPQAGAAPQVNPPTTSDATPSATPTTPQPSQTSPTPSFGPLLPKSLFPNLAR